jgi:hypothetical protein
MSNKRMKMDRGYKRVDKFSNNETEVFNMEDVSAMLSES